MFNIYIIQLLYKYIKVIVITIYNFVHMYHVVLRVQARIEKNKTVEEKVVGGGGEIDVTNGKERIDMIRETAQ